MLVENPSPVISTERLKNGTIRHHIQNNGYYDEIKNGPRKYYDSEGNLKFISAVDGTSYLFSSDGKLYSKTAPNGNLTLYNPDGTVKHEFIAKKSSFSKIV